MRRLLRLESYVLWTALLMGVLICSSALWIKLDLNQTASESLISTMDRDSKKREAEMAAQIKAGLDKSDGIAESAKKISDGNTVILQDIQKLLAQHTETIKKVSQTSIEAEQAAKASASASKRAVRQTAPKPSWFQRMFASPTPSPRKSKR
jgi:methyl-accepting chemotaxis protein